MAGREYCAVVTGASRGIGRAIARRLASAGLPVAAVSRTLRPGSGSLAGSLEETVSMIGDDGGSARAFVADLGDAGLDRCALVREIETAMVRPVGVLVNNAAATRRYDVAFADMERDWFYDTIETNLWSTWELMRAVIPSMRRLGAGWVVNLSSRQAGPRVGPPFAPHPLAGSVLYGGSKAFLDRLTTGAAMELYEDHIAVNSLAPNRGVATEHASNAVPGWPSEPEETMAEAALLLASSDPAQVTGRVAYSLPLLKEFDRAVYGLDGRELLTGWQPADLDLAGFPGDYLTMAPPAAIPAEVFAARAAGAADSDLSRPGQ